VVEPGDRPERGEPVRTEQARDLAEVALRRQRDHGQHEDELPGENGPRAALRARGERAEPVTL